MRSGVDSRLLEIGALTKEQWAAVTAEVGKMSDLPMKTDDSAEITINQLRERALGAIDDGFLSKKPIGLILVDYIQRMRVPQEDKRKNRHEQVEDMARGLKELAKSTGLPVVAAAQLKRIPEGRPGRRPTMDDLRESGGLESEADVVCLIHRGHQYDAKVAEDDAELLIDKNRHGQPGLINVRWHAALTRFDNLDSGHMST
jgi:replicative DNA helicase